MRFSVLPQEVLGLVLTSIFLHSQRVSASPAINVALQASFNAPPYILELLLVTLLLHCFLSIVTDRRAGKQLQKKIAPPTSPS